MPLSVNHRVVAAAEEMAENGERDLVLGEAKIRETKEWIQTLLIVATLIAAVTFSAQEEILGGASSDTDNAVRMHSVALKAFIITNTLGFCFSMLAVILCFHVHRVLFWCSFENDWFSWVNIPVQIKWANILLQCAVLSTMVSYSICLYITVLPARLWLVITIFIVAYRVPSVGTIWKIALFFNLTKNPVNDGQVNEPVCN